MPKRRVVLTGVGAITPVGNNIPDFWDAVVTGKTGVRLLTAFDCSGFNSHIAAEVKNFDALRYMTSKQDKRLDLFVKFALAAAKIAFEDSGLDSNKMERERIGVYMGSGIGGLHTIEEEHIKYMKTDPAKAPSKISPFLIPMLIVNMASGIVSIELGLKGPNSCAVTACATASNSIGDAFKILQRGDADVMFAGGSEAATTPMGFGGFCALKALSTRNDNPEKASRPFDRDRDGFIMGEGASVVVLEELEHARKRGARIYCEMMGYGMSSDAYHMTAPDPTGDGAVRCMTAALKDAELNAEDVDYINAHGTSTQLNDKMETGAIKRVFGDRAKKIPVSSTKGVTGHLLGATGGAELIACMKAIENQVVPPTINYETPDPECDLDYVPNTARETKVDVVISNSLGFGGHNVTLAIKKFVG
ncbi:MAG: beta-ketoacyl-ACP synthase II [Candidatus Omnitrophica bacterium]|nr:beta-ketoacyl-ACP synthase II [Candidatus Omnitrophota bacterium]MBU1128662.1 beta-ketoacyl-ACP synthase II [Candidatus Omnitrophota bacterium]MBU1852208.1 beta-ketoacyl-ACP synthase II [Candidatus Omnitrophota bacterium]